MKTLAGMLSRVWRKKQDRAHLQAIPPPKPFISIETRRRLMYESRSFRRYQCSNTQSAALRRPRYMPFIIILNDGLCFACGTTF